MTNNRYTSRRYLLTSVMVSLVLAGGIGLAYVIAGRLEPFGAPPKPGCSQFYEQGLKAAYGFRDNLGDVYLREAMLWLAVHQSCAMEEGRK